MRAAPNIPVYRLRSSRGLATMRELWRFAFFVADQLQQDVQVEGVTRVRALPGGGSQITAPPLVEGTPASTMRVMAPPPAYRFRRSRGLALKSDLDDYAAWLQQRLAAAPLRSNEIRAAATGGEAKQAQFKPAS